MKKTKAFSLIELLVVLGIVSLLTAMAVPSFNLISNGVGLSQAGQIVADQISLARQEALAKNKEMQVRFFKINQGGAEGWRAVQVWKVEEGTNGPVEEPVGKMTVFPQGVIITDTQDLSPLLGADGGVSGEVNVPQWGNLEYEGFRFQANGSMQSVATDKNFVTLQRSSDSGSPPANFYTVQVNPVTGKVGIYRP